MTDEQGESPKERVDRELIELLNGLRVALPGVQVLFAFLLTVPFAQGFGRTSNFQQLVYVICLLSAAVATTAPTIPVGALETKDSQTPGPISNACDLIGLSPPTS